MIRIRPTDVVSILIVLAGAAQAAMPFFNVIFSTPEMQGIATAIVGALYKISKILEERQNAG